MHIYCVKSHGSEGQALSRPGKGRDQSTLMVRGRIQGVRPKTEGRINEILKIEKGGGVKLSPL